MPRSVGLYGGFFNPFHKGHLHVIRTSLKSLNLEELVVLPTFHNPLKSNSHASSINEQISKIESAINLSNVKVSDFEHSHQITSTQELLQKIQTIYPLNSCYLIIGLDQLGKLHLWKDYQWIIQNISICVIYRPRYDDFIENSTVKKQHPNLFMPNLAKFIKSSTTCFYIMGDSGVNLSSSELRDV